MFREAVAIYDKDARFQAALGDCELRFKHYPEAEAALKRAVELDRKNAGAWTELSRVYAVNGNGTEAEKAVQAALKVAPRDAVACAQLGLLLAGRGDLKAAEKMFEDARSLPQDNAEYWSLSGRYYHLLNKPQEMEAAFRQAVLLDPTQPEYAEWLGLCLMSLGKNAEAEDCLATATKLDDSDIDYWLALGQLRLGNEHYQGAAEAYQHVVDLQPKNINALRSAGLAQYAAGNYAEAEKQLQTALRSGLVDDDATTTYFLSLLRQRKLVELERQLTAWLSVDKNKGNQQAWVFLGDTLAFSGKPDAARDAYKHLLSLNPPEELRAYAVNAIKSLPQPKELETVIKPEKSDVPGP